MTVLSIYLNVGRPETFQLYYAWGDDEPLRDTNESTDMYNTLPHFSTSPQQSLPPILPPACQFSHELTTTTTLTPVPTPTSPQDVDSNDSDNVDSVSSSNNDNESFISSFYVNVHQPAPPLPPQQATPASSDTGGNGGSGGSAIMNMGLINGSASIMGDFANDISSDGFGHYGDEERACKNFYSFFENSHDAHEATSPQRPKNNTTTPIIFDTSNSPYFSKSRSSLPNLAEVILRMAKEPILDFSVDETTGSVLAPIITPTTIAPTTTTTMTCQQGGGRGAHNTTTTTTTTHTTTSTASKPPTAAYPPPISSAQPTTTSGKRKRSPTLPSDSRNNNSATKKIQVTLPPPTTPPTTTSPTFTISTNTHKKKSTNRALKPVNHQRLLLPKQGTVSNVFSVN